MIRVVLGLERQVLGCPNDSPPIEAVPVIAPGIPLAANFPWRLSVQLCLRYPVHYWVHRWLDGKNNGVGGTAVWLFSLL